MLGKAILFNGGPGERLGLGDRFSQLHHDGGQSRVPGGGGPVATILTMLRPESWTSPAGVSPVRAGARAPDSGAPLVAETRRAERGVESLFVGSKRAGRSTTRCESCSLVKYATGEPSRSFHGEGHARWYWWSGSSSRLWEQQRIVSYNVHRWTSARSMKRARQWVKALTGRSRGGVEFEEMIGARNLLLQVGSNYFRTGNASDKFRQLDRHLA